MIVCLSFNKIFHYSQLTRACTPFTQILHTDYRYYLTKKFRQASEGSYGAHSKLARGGGVLVRLSVQLLLYRTIKYLLHWTPFGGYTLLTVCTISAVPGYRRYSLDACWRTPTDTSSVSSFMSSESIQKRRDIC
jgi:hypothetical protein